MNKKYLLCAIFEFIGFIMWVIGLALLHNISTTAWLYGILAGFGVLIFTLGCNHINNIIKH